MEILLVEASLSEARTAFDVLERGNVRCRVSLVRDAAEAVAFLQRKSIFARAPRPDLILLAADLPMHGSYEVFSSIRNDEKLKAIPTVVLSDKALSPAQSSAVCTSTTDILPGESSGLTDVSYMPKPLAAERFVQMVKRLHFALLSQLVSTSL